MPDCLYHRLGEKNRVGGCVSLYPAFKGVPGPVPMISRWNSRRVQTDPAPALDLPWRGLFSSPKPPWLCCGIGVLQSSLGKHHQGPCPALWGSGQAPPGSLPCSLGLSPFLLQSMSFSFNCPSPSFSPRLGVSPFLGFPQLLRG